MKLLVADDEKIVQDAIRLIIEREGIKEIEFKSVSTGGAAIEMARLFQPDVIFLDIDMPGLNGLEALESIRKFAPEVIVVIITAYDVFQYAQTAIYYGVYDYLLKPFTPAKIKQLLNRIQETLQSNAYLQKNVIRLKERMASMETIINCGILNMMITQTGMISTVEKECLLQEAAGRILLISVDSVEKQRRADREIHKCALEKEGILFGPFICGQAVVFVPRSISIQCLFNRFASALDQEGFQMACGRLQPNLNTLWISYHQAIEAMHTMSGSLRIYYEEEKTLENKIESYRKLAEHCLCTDNIDAVLTDVLQQVTVINDLQKSILQVSHLVMILCEYMYAKSPSNLKYSQDINFTFAKIAAAGNVADVRKEFCSLVMRLRGVLFEGQATSDNQTVQEVLRYIHENLQKNISLEVVARHINVSAGTLGRILRGNLGKSFVEILTEERIKKAILLIRSGKHSMKEICFMVGYNDPNYFSRVFKRVTGENPSSYKQ